MKTIIKKLEIQDLLVLMFGAIFITALYVVCGLLE